MQVWFTRPSHWDVYVAGVGRCKMWLSKPVFDAQPRGKERDSLYPDLPLGWRVQDPLYGDITDQVVAEVRYVLRDADYQERVELLNALFDALCRSIDGMGADEMGGALKRWKQAEGCSSDNEPAEMATFCFEANVPPELWFRAAWHNGFSDQTATGAWAQQVFWFDTEMGLEADELPPVANPVVVYSAARTALGAQ